MKNHIKKNQNKQKLQNRAKKTINDMEIYKKENAYKVISVVHLSNTMDLNFKAPYNFIRRDFNIESNLLESSYVIRASDLLILTIAGTKIEMDYLRFLMKYMPSTMLVYGDDTNSNISNLKHFSKSISKILGDIKFIHKNFIDNTLKTFITKTNSICSNRPFMVVKDKEILENGMILGGFMKLGLMSNKIIINGSIEALIDEVFVDGVLIKGENLNVAVPSTELRRIATNEDFEDSQESIESDEDSQEFIESESIDLIEFEKEELIEFEKEDEIIDSKIDLITKFKDYRGIRNLATCKFNDQIPDFYKNLLFFNQKMENSISKINKNLNKYVQIKINKIISDENIIVFNLFEYETEKTIMNYSFSGSVINKNIKVDNGFRIFTAKTFLSDNLPHNAFTVHKNADHGIVSFIAPISFFSKNAQIIDFNENNCSSNDFNSFIKLVDGISADRLFLISKTLSGIPIKIFKRYSVIKGMFYDSEQVEYFRNIKIEGKNGNVGFIKGPLGTKGLFKAFFTTHVKHGEKITMKLYKREFLPE